MRFALFGVTDNPHLGGNEIIAGSDTLPLRGFHNRPQHQCILVYKFAHEAARALMLPSSLISLFICASIIHHDCPETDPEHRYSPSSNPKDTDRQPCSLRSAASLLVWHQGARENRRQSSNQAGKAAVSPLAQHDKYTWVRRLT